IQEIPRKQTDADAQLQHEDLRFQQPGFLGLHQRSKEHLGRVLGQVPSLLMTNGTGEASEINALLPRSRRYFCPNSHSSDSAKGTKSWITSRLDWDLERIDSGEEGSLVSRAVCFASELAGEVVPAARAVEM